jgi:hypothetical protein
VTASLKPTFFLSIVFEGVQNVLYLLNCVPLSANAMLFAHRALVFFISENFLLSWRAENEKCARQKVS